MFQSLLDRAKEPSTYAGLGTILAIFGLHVVPEKLTAIITTLTAVAGLLAVFLPEKKA